MSFAKGYYSIIQYCPDPSRLEAVNIGVALFCPELRFLKAAFGRRRTPISQLFGKQDWEFVTLQQSAIEARLARNHEAFETLEDFQAYISRRANALVMTTPRPVKVANPEAELEHLRQRLVGAARKEPAHRAKNIDRELEYVFRQKEVFSGLRRDVTVRHPALPTPVKVPFAYQNGRFNLIDPMRFEGQSASKVFSNASVEAVNGAFLGGYRDPKFGELSLVVVAKFGADQGEEAHTAKTGIRRSWRSDVHVPGIRTSGRGHPHTLALTGRVDPARWNSESPIHSPTA